MVGGIEFSTYQRIAKLNHTIENVISEATQTKTLLSGNLLSDFAGIGGRVDITI